jgi:hypothetical protein
MTQINMQRVALGALAAGAVIFVAEGIFSQFYMGPMQASLEAYNLSMDVTVSGFVLAALVSLLIGFALVWFYAAVRPRFGPGPKAAALVSVVLWLGGYVPSVLGFKMMGMFTDWLLVFWALTGLIEVIVATMVGGWLYMESESGVV